MSAAGRQTSKSHRRLVRTGLGACIAYLVGVRGMATPAGGIGVKTRIVRNGSNARSVAVNVNIARSSSAPREIYLVSSLHFVATRSEANLSRGWRRSRSNRSCRCRTWGGVGVGVAVAVGVGVGVAVGSLKA